MASNKRFNKSKNTLKAPSPSLETPITISNSDKLNSILTGDYIIVIPFLVLILIPAYLSFKYNLIPLQDLPNHLANVKILLYYNSSPFFQQYFKIDFFPYPYIMQDILLAFFMKTGGPDFAASSFVAIILILMPLSVLYLVKTVKPDKLYLAYFSLPFIWNTLFWRGNLGFLLGLSIANIGLAYLWRNLFYQEHNRATHWVRFASYCLLLYLTHLVAFAIFIFIGFTLLLYVLFKANKYRILSVFVVSVAVAVFGLAIAFQDHLTTLNLNPSLSDKWYEVKKVFSVLDKGDCYFLIPLVLLLFTLVLAGTLRVTEEPLPFIVCAALLLLYLIIPADLKPLVKPHERILYALIFIVPLCCTNKKYLTLEKYAVILFCTVTFLYSSSYFNARWEALSGYLMNARYLINKIPGEKKLIQISTETYIGHVDAYNVIDNNGYVPTLFSASYMMVRYREAPVFTPDINKITYEMIINYDYILFWGLKDGIVEALNRFNFQLIGKSADYGIFKNTLYER